MPNHQFRAIKPLDSINYLVATENDGWYKINLETEAIEPYDIFLNHKKAKMPSRNFIITDSIIWANGNAGIIKVNPKTRVTESFRHYPIIDFKKANDSTLVYDN